ncbi:MAG: hypothetical protein R6V03_05185 [Kiritimatiellia bacterium]
MEEAKKTTEQSNKPAEKPEEPKEKAAGQDAELREAEDNWDKLMKKLDEISETLRKACEQEGEKPASPAGQSQTPKKPAPQKKSS